MWSDAIQAIVTIVGTPIHRLSVSPTGAPPRAHREADIGIPVYSTPCAGFPALRRPHGFEFIL
jgi:hypothetical protein